MYVCVCVYFWRSVYIRIRTCECMYVCVCISGDQCIYEDACVCVCMCVCCVCISGDQCMYECDSVRVHVCECVCVLDCGFQFVPLCQSIAYYNSVTNFFRAFKDVLKLIENKEKNRVSQFTLSSCPLLTSWISTYLIGCSDERQIHHVRGHLHRSLLYGIILFFYNLTAVICVSSSISLWLLFQINDDFLHNQWLVCWLVLRHLNAFEVI